MEPHEWAVWVGNGEHILQTNLFLKIKNVCQFNQSIDVPTTTRNSKNRFHAKMDGLMIIIIHASKRLLKMGIMQSRNPGVTNFP